jgi:hypothetical protein
VYVVTVLGDEARKRRDVDSDRKVVAFEVHDVGHEPWVVEGDRRVVVSHPRLVAYEGGRVAGESRPASLDRGLVFAPRSDVADALTDVDYDARASPPIDSS